MASKLLYPFLLYLHSLSVFTIYLDLSLILSCTAFSLYLPTLRARVGAAAMGAAKPTWPNLLAALTAKGATGALNWWQVAMSAAVSL